VLELVKEPVEIDPIAPYVSIGIRSFGKGLFHYPERAGSEIGKLRFQSVQPDLLAISNIKGWEGAVATTSEGDLGAVASNRFLFFRPLAGSDAVHYFWSVLLDGDGLAAIGRASPGSADRNRTLAIDRFKRLELPLPSLGDQAAIGRVVGEVRAATATQEQAAQLTTSRINALLPAALNEAFAGLI
jgi:type I restriction enzyme S subunit